MTKIKLGNIYAIVEDAPPEVIEFIAEYLVFDDDQAYWAKRKHGYRGDIKIRLFERQTKRFLAGLASSVVKACRQEGFEIEVIDDRLPPVLPNPMADLDWLEQDPRGAFQAKAIQAAIEAGRGIIHLSTGSGKTECGIGLIRSIPCHWLVICHKKDLMHQFAKRWVQRGGHEPGLIGDGIKKPDPERRLTCATFQTLSKATKAGEKWALDFLSDVEGIITDECHCLAADSYLNVAIRTRRAYWRFGLSATPLARGDKRSVFAVGLVGPVIYRIKATTLAAAGLLATPVIKMPRLEQNCGRPTWDGVYGEVIVHSAQRNSMLINIAKQVEKPALLFVKEINHGKELLRRATKAKIKTEFVWGDKATESRNAAIKRLRFGDTDLIVCSTIFNEGVDIPEVRAVVIGSGGKSAIQAIQRIGRGMRLSGNKTTFEVWDINDLGYQLPLPPSGSLDDPKPTACARHAKARVNSYRKEGFEVLLLNEIDD